MIYPLPIPVDNLNIETNNDGEVNEEVRITVDFAKKIENLLQSEVIK